MSIFTKGKYQLKNGGEDISKGYLGWQNKPFLSHYEEQFYVGAN